MAGKHKLLLNTGWLAKREGEVEWAGEQLSSNQAPGGKSAAKEGWLPAVVPGTVLTTLVHNKIYPEPFFGMNNEEIPDIGAVGRNFYTFWFCNEFHLPRQCHPETKKGKESTRVWLNFRGINYSAEVYVNGVEIHLEQPRGMFLRRQLDITHSACLGGTNHVAVLVHPPDHPGRVEGGGQGGDHDIAKDVTAQYVEGWDWTIPIRDRNTGMWDEVSVTVTGPVIIKDPHLVSTFTDGSFQEALLHISTDLSNAASSAATGQLTVQVSLEVEGDICLVHTVQSEEVAVGPGETLRHTFQPLAFERPELWWPNGLGPQPLYTVEIALEINGYGESDVWSERFGFRQIESRVDAETKGRVFRVNGQPLFIRGGNWIASDGMLRLSRERYETEINFHADANLNMLRVWGGALAERPDFYDACDERGLLVWQEFWITGDCNGRGVAPSEPSWPLDHPLFLGCARDTVRMLRNHPSLALWVGGNETTPAPDLNRALVADLKLNPSLSRTSDCPSAGEKEGAAAGDRSETGPPDPSGRDSEPQFEPDLGLSSEPCPKPNSVPSSGPKPRPHPNLTSRLYADSDPTLDSTPCPPQPDSQLDSERDSEPDPSLLLDGTRAYVPGSLWGGFGEGHGAWSDGPYQILNPEDFYADGFYPWRFNPEIGNVGVPEAATIRATLEKEHWDPPELKELEGGGVEEVANKAWEYHTFIPYSKPGMVRDQIAMYGRPRGLDDFCEKAQLANYVQYRALIESWNSRMWTGYTGVLIWKTQNPWPGLRGQLYDWLLDVCGGLYGVRSAAEPIHVQINLLTRFVEIVNTTSRKLEQVAVQAAIYNLDGSCPDKATFGGLTLAPFTTSRVFQVPDCTCMGASAVYFLVLTLSDSEGVNLSRNFYWMCAKGGDYTLLEGNFRSRKIPILAKARGVVEKDGAYAVSVRLTNVGGPRVTTKDASVGTAKGGVGSSTMGGMVSAWGPQNVTRGDSVGTTESGGSSRAVGTTDRPSYPSETRVLHGTSRMPSGELGFPRQDGGGQIRVWEGPRGKSVGTETGHGGTMEPGGLGVAFFMRLSVCSTDPNGGSVGDGRIRGVRFSDNYISLVPGESLTVEIRFKLTRDEKPRLVLRGWNVEEQDVPLSLD